MKRILIALLMMAVVLVGVFAVDPAKTDANGTAVIDIKVTINEQFPAYKLTATSVPAGTINTADSAVANSPTHGLVTLTPNDLLDNNATVSFSIIQTQVSRAIVTYNIGVAATDLVMTKNPDGTAYTGAADSNHKFALVSPSATPVISYNPGKVSHVTVSGTNAGSTYGVTAVYDGVKVAANTVIGTFSCEWASNAEAASGDYEADVTLYVQAV